MIEGVKNTKDLLGPETRICALVAAEPKVGKAQGLNSKVLTPTGFMRMGDVQLGQPLASIDGKPSFVIGITPQGKKALYRVTFHDGRSTLACLDHLWDVRINRKKGNVVDTSALLSMTPEALQECSIPTFTGHFGEDVDLPIEPWLLGSLLGDGGFTNTSLLFTKEDQGVVAAVSVGAAAEGCRLKSSAAVSYRVVGQEHGTNTLLPKLGALGLRGHLSVDKFIPAQYLTASRASRLALLRGLMDTDGSNESGYTRMFNTSSRQLALDVQYLIRSLGGLAVLTSRIPHYTHNGEYRAGERAYRVAVSNVPDAVFVHSRKADDEHIPKRERHLYFQSIELESTEEAQCIQVSHSSHLYVTDDFVVTHNSVFAASLDKVTRKYRDGRRTLVIACEEAEGGGTMSLHDLGIDYVVPKNWQHMESLLAQLKTDQQYGGIVLDNATDYVGRIVKPYALAFPSKEENSKYAGTRIHGVLQQSDHIPLAEFMRQHVAKLITLTSDRVEPQFRKDLIVTVLEKERKTREGASQGFHPDLPGALAAGVSAMFQSVVWLRKDAKVVGAGTTKAQRLDVRILVSGGDAQRPIMGDRMGLFPMEASLTDDAGKPVGLLPLYEQWRSRIDAKKAA